MPANVEKLTIRQLESHLLSDEYQWDLEGDITGAAGHGLDKRRHYDTNYAALLPNFPDLTAEIVTKMEGNLGKFGPRVVSHVQRLLNPARTIEENYFGLLFTLYGAVDNEEYPVYPDVAGDESNNVSFFWSFAPYLARELRTLGLKPSEIMSAIFKWGEKGNDPEKPIPGTEKFYDSSAFYSRGMYLTLDPSDKTHDFAKGVAKLMCAKTQPFKKLISQVNPNYAINPDTPLMLFDQQVQ